MELFTFSNGEHQRESNVTIAIAITIAIAACERSLKSVIKDTVSLNAGSTELPTRDLVPPKAGTQITVSFTECRPSTHYLQWLVQDFP